MRKLGCATRREGAVSIGLALLAALVAAPRAGVAEDAVRPVGFQGRLLEADGLPVDGTPDFDIRVYDALDEGSNLLFRELHTNVPLEDGVFNVAIGTGLLIAGEYGGLFDEDGRVLEVHVDGERLEPRLPFDPVAYAFLAANAVQLGEVHYSSYVVRGQPASVGPGMLEPETVATPELVDGAVTQEKLGDGSVTNAKIAEETITADRLVAGEGSGLDADLLDGLDSTDLARRPRQVLIVDALGNVGFRTVQEALDAIDDSSPPHRYLVKILPGEYPDGFLMKPGVDVEGSGRSVTTIGGQVGTFGTGELRSLSIVVDGASDALVHVPGGGVRRVTDVFAASRDGAGFRTNPDPGSVTIVRDSQLDEVVVNVGTILEVQNSRIRFELALGPTFPAPVPGAVTIRGSEVEDITVAAPLPGAPVGWILNVENTLVTGDVSVGFRPSPPLAHTVRCVGSYDGSRLPLDSRCN